MTAPPPPPQQYLATGFRDVDGSTDTPACTRCLDLIAGIPFFRRVKDESFRILAGTRPGLVLDAGCGAGNDLLALAGLLSPDSKLIGLDASARLLATAAERIADHRARCCLVRGDLLYVPFRKSTFAACRIDRVLQHLHDPGRVVQELVRVLEPGGTLVVFDNDWDTLTLSLDNRHAAAALTRFWSDSFASGRVGKDLATLFSDAGLTDVVAEPRTLALTDPEIAEKVFDIPALLDRMNAAGLLNAGEVHEIKEDLARNARRGTFASGYTGYLVRGRKPV
jgi:SAM-dependent methyltransferase